MQVWLTDLCSFTEGNNAIIMPLNVGYIASYLKKTRPDIHVTIFKDPTKVIDYSFNQIPDIVGLSNYTWNERLNCAIIKRIKEINPKVVTVMGGPSFDRESLDWVQQFFNDRPQLDFYIVDEGERGFAKLIELLDAYYGDSRAIPIEEWPSTFWAFNHTDKAVLNNPNNAVGRIDLEEVPSPYLSGVMDEFLNDGRLQPIIETNRGCPYTCTFCSWGATTKDKLFQFPLETVFAEIEYIAKNYSNSNGGLYFADGNFGILKRDMEISRFVKKCTKSYGFPKRVYVYFAKNLTDEIVEIADNMKSITKIAMSKQSMNEETLRLIKRRNIKNEKYDELRERCEENGIETFCEFIYMLPGETYKSFLCGVIDTIRSGQNVTLNPLRTDSGAELATTAYRKEHGFKTAFRILPKSAWKYKDCYTLEYDEIVIENNNISQDEFYRIRLFHFLLFVLSSPMFHDLRKGLWVNNLDHGTFAKKIAEDENHWTPLWANLLGDFRRKAKEELVCEDQTRLTFTKEEFEKINIGETALNPFFLSRVVASQQRIADLRMYLADSLERFFAKQIGKEAFSDLIKILDISFARIVCYENFRKETEVFYHYDLDAWHSCKSKLPLRTFSTEKETLYKLSLEEDIILAFKKARNLGNDTEHAVYHIRMYILHLWGDRIFSFKREKILDRLIGNST